LIGSHARPGTSSIPRPRLPKLAQRSSRWADPWCDTTSAHGRLMLTVLGGLAEFERHLILARTSEGRKRAQARGVRFGRKPKLTAHQQREAVERRARGEAYVDITRSYAVSHSTISRLANEVGQTARVPGRQPSPSPRPELCAHPIVATKKSTSFRQLKAGNNKSLSSNFLTSARSSGGTSLGSLYSSLRPWPIRAMTNHQISPSHEIVCRKAHQGSRSQD
jgi:resolvase-like protein